MRRAITVHFCLLVAVWLFRWIALVDDSADRDGCMGLDVVYLDYNATTPVAPGVLDAMLPWFTEHYGNPASVHSFGRQAADAVASARERFATCIGAGPSEIVFTSGATEANNIALKGAVELVPTGRNRVVIAATEHKAVLDTANCLEQYGFVLTILPVDREGGVNSELLRDALDPDVAIVSVMLANNETGVISPIAEFAELAHQYGALFHTDASQALGKITVDVRELDVDLASFSAHKMYGPKGVGALYARRGVSVAPLLHGGGHERGLRSGTLNTPGIVGFGAAADFVGELFERGEPSRQESLVQRLVQSLSTRVRDIEFVAGAALPRLPNTANIRVKGADSEAVMANVPNVAISSGSACTALVPAPSHVLVAMGRTHEEAGECLRLSVGSPTSVADIDEAVSGLVPAIKRVRELSR